MYQDAVRIGERIVDFQFQMVFDRLERTDRLVRLGVATLAGMIAVVGLMATRRVQLDAVETVFLAVGFLSAMIAVFLLARLNTGLHREQLLSFGPDLSKVCVSIEKGPLDEPSYYQVLSDHLSAQIDLNFKAIRSLSSRQDHALLVLSLGALLHLTAIAYIVGRHILV